MSSPEAIIQSKIIIQFSQRFPDQRGHLFSYFANSDSAIQGAQKLSLGLVKNVSDLLYVKDGYLIGIELKAPLSSHNRLHLVGQSDWLIKVPNVGWFCDSLEMFFSIIDGENGIDPRVVRENCLKLTTTTVSWDKIKI